MNKIVVIGAGWGGCAAAIQASKSGAEVVLLERTDMILGTGLVGGIMMNNGRYTAAIEMKEMGGGELFDLTEKTARHKNIEFPGHKHANLYDIVKTVKAVEDLLEKKGVTIMYQQRVDSINMDGHIIQSIGTTQGKIIEGDVFIDATGTAGPVKSCNTNGNGCVMCIYRCPSFGGRVSICQLAGIEERINNNAEGKAGAMSGSCKILKESLSQKIQEELNEKGVAIIPIPDSIDYKSNLSQKACQQYNHYEFSKNLILLDTGHAKLMISYFPLNIIKKVPGFEMVRYEDPYAAGIGNSVRFTQSPLIEKSMKVVGADNLYCAGEKSAMLIGHTEGICTGVLAGYNAGQYIHGYENLVLPEELTVGDAIAYAVDSFEETGEKNSKITFSGARYFERMKEKGLYTTEREEIHKRVMSVDCINMFS